MICINFDGRTAESGYYVEGMQGAVYQKDDR